MVGRLQPEISIELFRKAGDNWSIIDYEPGDMVELTSVKLTFPLAEPLRMRIEQVYEDVVFAFANTSSNDNL